MWDDLCVARIHGLTTLKNGDMDQRGKVCRKEQFTRAKRYSSLKEREHSKIECPLTSGEASVYMLLLAYLGENLVPA